MQSHKTARPRKQYYLLVSLFLMLAGWLLIGFDRYVGDHEIGVFWQPFVKSKPTFQIRFHNPAQYALDFDPFDTLDSERKKEFLEYCSIRYGVVDPYRCEKAVEVGRI